MPEIRVGSDAVRDAGLRAQTLVAEFVDGLDECDAMVASLVSDSWTGPASTVFHAGWTEWHRGASEVHQALAGIARLLGESAVQYEQTESAVTQVSRDSSVTVGDAR
jgi:WXG100 family type VII secretion target